MFLSDVVVQICNPSTQKAKAGGLLQILGQVGL